MDNIIDYGVFKPVGSQDEKTLIVLCNTNRYISDFLQMLKYRNNGDYKKIPNFVIARDGKILRLLSNSEYGLLFNNEIDRKSIVISLENLGWVEKEPLTTHYVNWIGDIYNGTTFNRKWRDYYFWHPYTEEQMNSLVELCTDIFNKTSVKNKIVGHNTKLTDFHNYEGVLCRSNFNVKYTDVTPAFNFEDFIKKMENG